MGKADEVLRNSSNSNSSAISVNNGTVIAVYSRSISETIALPEICKSLFFINDGVAGDIVITIGGLAFTLKTNEGMNEAFEPFTEVVVTNASSEPYRMWVRK